MCLAIPGKVVEIYDRKGLRVSKVEFGGITREVCLEYVPEATLGDFVLVHVGFALSVIDAEEAARTYEILEQMGQLAELEALAVTTEEQYPLPVVGGPLLEIDARPLIQAVVADLERAEPVGRISGRVHSALAGAIAETCRRIRERTGLATVALAGGCFQNRLLTEQAVGRLGDLGFEVLLHTRVPPNDGGIALGQAAVAAWRAVHVPGDSR